MGLVPTFYDKASLKKASREDRFIAGVIDVVNERQHITVENIAKASGLFPAEVININKNMDPRRYRESFNPQVLIALAQLHAAASGGEEWAVKEVMKVHGMYPDGKDGNQNSNELNVKIVRG